MKTLKGRISDCVFGRENRAKRLLVWASGYLVILSNETEQYEQTG